MRRAEGPERFPQPPERRDLVGRYSSRGMVGQPQQPRALVAVTLLVAEIDDDEVTVAASLAPDDAVVAAVDPEPWPVRSTRGNEGRQREEATRFVGGETARSARPSQTQRERWHWQ